MADSEPPFTPAEDCLFSFPSSISYKPLTEYSRYSQRKDSQNIPTDHIEVTNITTETTDIQTNICNPNLSIQITSNDLGTMDDSKSTLLPGLDTMHGPYFHSEVLVPNPLLSHVTGFEGYMSTDQDFLDTSNVLSPNSLPECTTLDEKSVPGISNTLLPPSVPHTPVSNGSTPVNFSLLGLRDIPFSEVTEDQIFPGVYSLQVPVLSTASIPAETDVALGRDSPVVDNERNEATRQQESGTVLPGFEPPKLMDANEVRWDPRYVRLHPQISYTEAACKGKSDIDFEERQILVPFEVTEAAHARENREKSEYSSLISPPTSVGCQGGLEKDSVNPSHETAVPKGQAEECVTPTYFDSFGSLPTKKYPDGYRSSIKAGKGLKQHRQVQNKIVTISGSLEIEVVGSKDEESPVLQHDYLKKKSSLRQPQRNSQTDSALMTKKTPGKRRRLHDSEEQIDYQEFKHPSHDIEPISLQIVSCYDEQGCQEEGSDHRFARTQDSIVSYEKSRIEPVDCDTLDGSPVWRRTFSDCQIMNREESSKTKLDEHEDYHGKTESDILDQNPHKKQNEQGDRDCGMPEQGENIHERNGTVCHLEQLDRSGNCGVSYPAHLVRSVEQKDGCMFMVLEVHEPAVCLLCDKKFPTQELLDLHIDKKHNGSTSRRRYRKRKRTPKEYQCTVCSLRLANDANLRRHYQILHEGETVETCSLCKANFNSHHGFVLHLRDLHGITPDSVQEKEGKNRKKRQYRRKKVAKVVPKRTWVVWKCGSCSFFTDNKGNMTRHINIVHLKIADHVCEECSEVFKTKHNLQVHLMNRHPKKPDGHAEK